MSGCVADVIGYGYEDSDDENETSELVHHEIQAPVLFPGEIEDTDCAQRLSPLAPNMKHTCLDFKAFKAETGEKSIEGPQSIESCDDTVSEFVLDESFDYDNVILTPKYDTQLLEKLHQRNLDTGKPRENPV